jgi:hypothetical protein
MKRSQDMSEGKVRLELFFESSGTAHMGFIPRRSDCKLVPLREVFCHLRKPNCPKSPKLWCRKNCLLLYNAPAHRCVVVHNELAKQQVTVLPHPPYSSELAKTSPPTVKLLCTYMAVGDWSLTYLCNRCICNISLISRFWLLVNKWHHPLLKVACPECCTQRLRRYSLSPANSLVGA